MYTEHLKRAFAKIGAELKVEVKIEEPKISSSYILDIIEQPRQEFYHLKISHNKFAPLDLQIINLQPKNRHLLLLAKEKESKMKDKLLCGHDERHWFVSTLRSEVPISNVDQAMESLKPRQVLASQYQKKVRKKNWHKRHNQGFIRQGEWFFLPRPKFELPNDSLMIRNEPFRRNWRGKPHIIEEVIRTGGEKVHVCSKFPTGISERSYQKQLKQNPSLKYENWRIMQKNPEVYVRGKVRHSDHKTIILPFWHLVVMNQERSNGSIAFLD